MEASTSDKAQGALTRSSATLAADAAEASAAAGASASASEPTEAWCSRAATSSVASAAAAAARPAPPASTDPVVRLPAAVAQLVFLLLPVHDRMRCRAVSRAWRTALADRGCWRILRFSGCKDLPRVRQPGEAERFILAASRAAGGAAEEIDARGLPYVHELQKLLKRVAEENGGSLRVLRMPCPSFRLIAKEGNASTSLASWVNPRTLPHLQELEADVITASVGEARRLLDDTRQPDGRFKALRIRILDLRAVGETYGTSGKQREVAESVVERLRTTALCHPSLTGLALNNMPLLHPGLIDAVAGTAVAYGLESLHLEGPHINHTCLPAVSRALRGGRLHDGSFLDRGTSTLDGPRSRHGEFCAALRGSRLETLLLYGMRLWADPDNGRALLAALTAHPTLRSLDISGDQFRVAEPKAEAIAALLEANAIALKSLHITTCALGAEHIERILGALRGNTHLMTLDFTQYSDGVDEEFAQRVVLPLVQANTTLRELRWDSDLCGAAGRKIDRIMQARADSGPAVTW